MIDDGTGLFTIGELTRSTGLTVRTIRFWSDEGVLPPVARSAGGYRLYDAGSVARLELIRTLRELGLGLGEVRGVLAGETTVAEVAAAHVAALDEQIRSLKVTRAVLSTVARRGSTAPETALEEAGAALGRRTRVHHGRLHGGLRGRAGHARAVHEPAGAPGATGATGAVGGRGAGAGGRTRVAGGGRGASRTARLHRPGRRPGVYPIRGARGEGPLPGVERTGPRQGTAVCAP